MSASHGREGSSQNQLDLNCFYRLLEQATVFVIAIVLSASLIQAQGEISRIWYFLPVAFFVGLRFRNRFSFSPSKIQLTVLTLALVSAGFRIYWALFSGLTQSSDSAYYIVQAENILAGKYWIDIYKQVGPGMMTALGLLMSGSNSKVGAVVPILLAGLLSMPLIYLVCGRLFGKSAALIALCISALWPEQIFYSTFINANLFQCFFLLLGFYLFLRADDFPNYEFGIKSLAGVCFGASQYMRGSGLIFTVVFLAFLLLRKQARSALAVLMGFTLLTTPILIKNYREFRFISFSPAQNSGFSMLIGSNHATGGHYFETYMSEVQEEIAKLPLDVNGKPTNPNAAEVNNIAKKLAWRKIQADPGLFLKMALTQKLPEFWANSGSLTWAFENTLLQTDQDRRESVERFSEGFHRMLIAFCILSCLVMLFRRPPRLPACYFGFLWGCLAVGSVHLIAEVQSPYHHAIGGFFVFLIAAGCSVVIQPQQTEQNPSNLQKKKFNLVLGA